MVTMPAEPVCTNFQVEPPSALRITEPAAVPVKTTWLLTGLTAKAKIAPLPCWGGGARATHVDGGSAPAICVVDWPPACVPRAPRTAQAQVRSATSVATRCVRVSDTSAPIITQPVPRASLTPLRVIAYNP